jgi:hypothetical protein
MRSLLVAVLTAFCVSLTAVACGSAAQRIQTAERSPRTPARPPRSTTAEEIETKYGIQITLVAVTAANGLVDVRFRVEDPAKAEVLFLPGNLPSIVTQDGKVTIPPPEQPEAPSLTAGQVYFLLYPNTGGAVRAGSRITLAFGQMGLQVVTAP